MENDVGAKSVGFSFFFPALLFLMVADSGSPVSLQVITIYPFGLRRLPLENTLCDEKKFMLSCPITGAIVKAPSSGICDMVSRMPLVSDTPLFIPFTVTFVPRNGMKRGRVNHYPYVGMDGIVWRHGCRMYIHVRNRCHVGVRQ